MESVPFPRVAVVEGVVHRDVQVRIKRGDKLMAEKMGAVTAGLPIPPGLKLF